jgi:hypothetical protein
VRRVIAYGLMGLGVLFVAPMWCQMGEGTMYDATAFVSVPAWVVAMIGLCLVGLGNFLLGPPLKERKAMRQAEEVAVQARLERNRSP